MESKDPRTEATEPSTIKEPVLTRRGLLIVISTIALVEIDAYAIEPGWLEVSEHSVYVPDLPDDLHGYKIAQITDLHLRSWDSLHDTIIQTLQDQQPDLLVLTGDMIDTPQHLSLLKKFCRKLENTGKDRVAIPGNWEYWGEVPFESLSKLYKESGIHFLRNQNLSLSGSLALAGTDDYLMEKLDIAQSVQNLPAAPFRLLLTHSPGFLSYPNPTDLKFDLVLAGHTHGGQVRLGPWAPFLPEGSGKFVSGFYNTPYGRTYVSRGIGTTFLDCRFFCRPELPIFNLYPA